MKQIDAAIALKILVATAPSGTADPTLKAMRFIEEAARLGRLQVRAFRGHATGETVPAVEVADLSIDFMARPSKVDLDLGEADLVTAGWGTVSEEDTPEGVPNTVWRNARFFRREIEGAKLDFVAWLEGSPLEPEIPSASPAAGKMRRQRASPKADAIERAAREIWPDGIPQSLADDRIEQKVLDHLKVKEVAPSRDTILRAVGRKAWPSRTRKGI